MLSLILKVVDEIKAEFAAFFQSLWALIQRLFDDFFSLTILSPGRTVIMPRLFDVAIDFISDVIDLVSDFLTTSLALAAARVTIDAYKPSKRLRQRVMTLDDVAKFTCKVIIDLGIREVMTQASPPEWRIARLGMRLEKLISFIKVPTLGRLVKIPFGGMWTKLISLVFLLVKAGKMLAYLILLWNFVRLVSKPESSTTLFGAKLTDKNPRAKEVVRLRRRIGGVPP